MPGEFASQSCKGEQLVSAAATATSSRCCSLWTMSEVYNIVHTQKVSWVLRAWLSFSSEQKWCHEGSFVYQFEIAAFGMWCTKSSLSANSHVLSTLRTIQSWKPQSSGSEAQRCYESPSRQLKNEGEKNSPHFMRTRLYALPSAVAVPLQKTSCCPCGLCTGLTKTAVYSQWMPSRLRQAVSSSALSCFLACGGIISISERSKVTYIFNEQRWPSSMIMDGSRISLLFSTLQQRLECAFCLK